MEYNQQFFTNGQYKAQFSFSAEEYAFLNDFYSSIDKRSLKEDVILQKFLIKHPEFFEVLPTEFKDDKVLMMPFIEQNGTILKFLSDNLKDDKDIVTSSIVNNNSINGQSFNIPDNIIYASDRLKDDKDIATIIVRRPNFYQKNCFHLLSNNMQTDKDIVLIALHNKLLQVSDIDENLFNEKSIVLLMLEQFPHILKKHDFWNIISPHFNTDIDVLSSVIKHQPEVFFTLNEQLQKNTHLAHVLIEKHHHYFSKLPEDIKDNPEFVINNRISFDLLNDKLKDNEDVIKSAIIHSFNASNAQSIFSQSSKRLQKKQSFLVDLIAINSSVFELIDDKITSSRSFVKKALKANPYLLKNIPHLIEDEEYVMTALKVDSSVFIYLSPELKDNDNVIMTALHSKKIDPQIYHSIHNPLLKEDIDVCKIILSHNGLYLNSIPEHLHNNVDLVQIAIEQNSRAYCYIGEKLKFNKELAMLAFKNDGSLLQYASSELRNDPYVVLTALKNNPEASSYIGNILNKDIQDSNEEPLSYLNKYMLHQSLNNIRNKAHNNAVVKIKV